MSVVTPAIESLIFPNFLVLLCFYFIEAEEKKLRETSLAASSRLKRALLKEKETKDCLQKSLNELQVWTLKRLATFTACEKKMKNKTVKLSFFFFKLLVPWSTTKVISVFYVARKLLIFFLIFLNLFGVRPIMSGWLKRWRDCRKMKKNNKEHCEPWNKPLPRWRLTKSNSTLKRYDMYSNSSQLSLVDDELSGVRSWFKA